MSAMARGKREAHTDSAKKKWTTSKCIAFAILVTNFLVVMGVLVLCGLSILRNFTGALPYLTSMIALLEGAMGYVLGHYFKKAAAENTKGGIVYDTTVGRDLL